MHRSVMQSEAEADPNNSTRNRILSATLAELLNERKMATRKDVETLANDYGMDVTKLESLARYLNTPSVGEGTRKVIKHGNGEETITTTVGLSPIARSQNTELYSYCQAVWEEPHYKP